MTHPPRSTDTRAIHHPRSERLFLQEGLWYFHTREGAPIGPFRYRNEAETMLERFVRTMMEERERQAATSRRPKPHFRTSALL